MVSSLAVDFNAPIKLPRNFIVPVIHLLTLIVDKKFSELSPPHPTMAICSNLERYIPDADRFKVVFGSFGAVRHSLSGKAYFMEQLFQGGIPYPLYHSDLLPYWVSQTAKNNWKKFSGDTLYPVPCPEDKDIGCSLIRENMEVTLEGSLAEVTENRRAYAVYTAVADLGYSFYELAYGELRLELAAVLLAQANRELAEAENEG